MGNQQASETNLSLTRQQREDWVKVQDQGFCELWANKKTNKRFQAYPISDSNAGDNVQIEKYAFRKIHNNFIVSAEAVLSHDHPFLCSEPASSFVLIENIIARLRSFPRFFTFEQALYILSCSASGYNTICSFFGPLEPNQDLVCFNDGGHVKVWLNQNLSKNEASPSAKSLEVEIGKGEDSNFARRRSRECVEKLLRIVQTSTAQGFPRGFHQETNNLSTFFELSNFVDYYCEQNAIKMPDHIDVTQFRTESTLNRGPLMASPRQSVTFVQPHSQQQAHSLQSSRVSKVFQSNHPRDGLISIPSQKIVTYQVPTNSQFRAPLQSPTANIRLNQGPPRIQNHKVTYIYPQQATISQPLIIPRVSSSQNFINIQIKNNVGQRQIEGEESSKQNGVAALIGQPNQAMKAVEKRQIQDSPHQKLKQQIRPSQQQIIILQQQPQFHLEARAAETKFYSNKKEEKIEQANQIYDEYYQNEGLDHNDPQTEHPAYSQQPAHQAYTQEREEAKSIEDEPEPSPQIQSQSYRQAEYQYSFKESQQPITESMYSQIQQYVPPTFSQHPPIEERVEEDNISPQKKSVEIEEWEEKLNSFTLSKEKPKIVKIGGEQKQVSIDTKEPSSFKNLVVSDNKEEYVNELADLESDDIQKYIRVKYQSYLSQNKTQPQYEENLRGGNYQVKAAKALRANTEQLDNETSTKEYYKSYEYKPRQNWVQNQEKQNQLNAPRYDINLAPNSNRVSIEQDCQFPSSFRKNDQTNYDFKPDTASYDYRQQTINYDYRYSSQPYQVDLQQFERNYEAKKEPQRRASKRTSTVIDEKYNKYVLNSQKPKRSLHINSKDVSLILPDQNHFRVTPRPILEKQFQYESFSNHRHSEKKGITYENLRNLLWEQ